MVRVADDDPDDDPNRKAIRFYANIQPAEAAPVKHKGNACFYLYAYDTEGFKCKLRGGAITEKAMRAFGMRWFGTGTDMRLPFATFLGDDVGEMAEINYGWPDVRA